MSPGIVAESDLSGNLKSEYVFFDGERVARKDFPTDAVSYYFSDRLKTASVITNSSGIITADEDYYPWGGEVPFLSNDSNHYKFTGKERDAETGLDYFGARYYGNWLDRFATPDDFLKDSHVGDPQSWNKYAYARNFRWALSGVLTTDRELRSGTVDYGVRQNQTLQYSVGAPTRFGWWK
jgi:RHS repeat-associated protein